MESNARLLSAFLDNVTDRILVLDVPALNIRYASRSFLDSLGMSPEEAVGKECRGLSGLECKPNGIGCAARKALETGASASTRIASGTGGGQENQTEITAHPLRDREGRMTHVIEIIREIPRRDDLQKILLQKSEFLETILQASPDGIVGNDRAGNIFLFNTGAERIFGYVGSEVVGKLHVSRLYPSGEAREIKEFIYSDQYGGRGRLNDYETTVISRNGKPVPIRLSCALLHDRGMEIGTVGFFQDISTRAEILRMARESEARFRGIVESARDAILTIGEDMKVLMANRAAEEMLGYEAGNIVGTEIGRLFPPAFVDNWDLVANYAASGDGREEKKYVETSALKKGGDAIPVHVSLSETRTPKGTSLTAILRDISDWKSQEEELRLLSITDPLTGLYNRRHFQSLAQREIARARRNQVPFSILLIDIDHFKSYNDRFGHPEGDNLLREAGEMIRTSFRSMDNGFRIGGEEFLVLLPETDPVGAMIPAERFRIRFSDRDFHPAPGGPRENVTVSIGIAGYKAGSDLDDLVRYADLAMYSAKHSGRNRCVNYDSLVEGVRPRPTRS